MTVNNWFYISFSIENFLLTHHYYRYSAYSNLRQVEQFLPILCNAKACLSVCSMLFNASAIWVEGLCKWVECAGVCMPWGDTVAVNCACCQPVVTVTAVSFAVDQIVWFFDRYVKNFWCIVVAVCVQCWCIVLLYLWCAVQGQSFFHPMWTVRGVPRMFLMYTLFDEATVAGNCPL